MRLIDADAFREWLCTLFAGHGTHEDDTKEEEEWNASLALIITHIDEAQTVERPQWIPCSERLPEKTGFYLITNPDGMVKLDYFRFGTTNEFDICHAVAWMPLPEPYCETRP